MATTTSTTRIGSRSRWCAPNSLTPGQLQARLAAGEWRTVTPAPTAPRGLDGDGEGRRRRRSGNGADSSRRSANHRPSGWVEVDWDTALDVVAGKLTAGQARERRRCGGRAGLGQVHQRGELPGEQAHQAGDRDATTSTTVRACDTALPSPVW